MIQFADSIGRIQVFNQVVRLELMAATADVKPGQGASTSPPALQPVGQLVLPIEGLIQMFNSLDSTMRQLAEAGLVNRGPAQGADPAAGRGALPSVSAGGRKRP